VADQEILKDEAQYYSITLPSGEKQGRTQRNEDDATVRPTFICLRCRQ
jgi:hypothetical protein